MLVVAYLWCTVLGATQKIPLKGHGRPAKAVFTADLNVLTRGLQQTGMLLEQFVHSLISLLTLRPYETVGY